MDEAPRGHVVLPAEGAVVYAVGDVHGCHEQLVRLDRRIVADGDRLPGRKYVVMLGDYVDRGPDTAAVIEHLTRPMAPGFTRVCLCGNHEQMMLRFLDDPVANAAWLDYGGMATMSSYGLDMPWLMQLHRRRPKEIARVLRATIPEAHVAFLRELPAFAVSGDLVFVHAGIRPGIPLDMQSQMDLFWIRQPFLAEGPRLPMIVIHGHSPTSRPSLVRNRLCIDTGVYASGRLTAVRCHASRGKLLSVGGR